MSACRCGSPPSLGLVIGTLAGLFNGFVITRFRVPPLIATLATLALYRGLAEGISQARSVRNYPDWFAALGQGEAWGVPSQLWVLFAALAVSAFVLGLTTFGRTAYAIGSNEVAARFSGLRVDRVKLAIYAASGFAAALAGIILVARVSTTRSDMGTGYELTAITAVVLGGTSIFGGRGTIIGTVLGLDSDAGAGQRVVACRDQGRRYDRGDRDDPDPDGSPGQYLSP